MTTSLRVLALLSALVLLSQCKKKDQPPPQNPYTVAPPPSQTQQPPPAPPPTATQAPPPNNVISGLLSAAAAQLGAFTGGALAPIAGGIQLKAGTDAKGMKPDGQMLSAQLTQGSHATAQITLEPGHCYSIVGFGGFGVMRYQINLATPPPAPPVVLASSKDTGIDPTLGPNEQCYRNPAPVAVPALVDMFLVQGQGMVGAQVYKK